MIDLSTETVVSLAEAPQYLPTRGGKRLNHATLWRWALKGLRGPAGELIRLEAVRLGSRWVTSREALQRFAERLTPDLAQTATTAPQTNTLRQRASERAAAELARAGI